MLEKGLRWAPSRPTGSNLAATDKCPSRPQSALHGVTERVHFRRLREDVRRDADSPGAADDPDVAGIAFLHDAAEIAFHRFEAHHAPVEGIGAGVGETELRVFADTVTHAAGEFMGALVDAGRADGVEKLERRFEADHHA